MMRRLSIGTFVLLLWLTADFVEACRYNVRETGYVDLGIESYRLFCYVRDSDGKAVRLQIDEAAQKTLHDSRFLHELVDVDAQSSHPAVQQLKLLEPGDPPAALLLSPRGRTLPFDLVWQDEMAKDNLDSFLSSLVASPLRDRLAKELAERYGVVLLIEGPESDQNERAKKAALDAIEEVEGALEYFPKPISRGPVLLTLRQEDLAEEGIMLWSLGLERGAIQTPHAAILYGRGRWIGPLLEGDEITHEMLSNILFVVGADCECGLDPRLIRGTGLPVQWNRELQSIVAQDLGFDPDNPLVRMEVSQILKVSSWFDPGATMESGESPGLGDLPVIDDRPAPDPQSVTLKTLVYLLGTIAVLIVGVGVFIWMRGRNSL